MKPLLLDLPMPIMTPRLVLRPPRVGDGVIVNAAVLESFDQLHPFMPWARKKQSPEETEEFVRQAAANWILKKSEEPWLPLFVFQKETDQFVGSTGFHNIDWEVPCLETGYWIRNRCAGQGLMTEAVNALTQYALKQLRVKRIAITCDINNIRSRKIPERLGYQLEATLKANRISAANSEVSDTLVYARYDSGQLPILTISY